MDGTTHLLDQLDPFVAEVGGRPATLSRSPDALLTNLNTAIPSFAGLIVNVRQHGHEVTRDRLRPPGPAGGRNLAAVGYPAPRLAGGGLLTLYAHDAAP